MREAACFLALLLSCALLLTGCTGSQPEPETSAPKESAPAFEPEESAPEESVPEPVHWEHPSPRWVAELPQAEKARQLFVVAVTGGSEAVASLHEKGEDGSWGRILKSEAFIGQNGLGKTAEGDRKTPVGTFAFNRAFGIAPDPGCAIPYVQVNGNHYWSGDQREGMHYNELVNIEELPDLDRESSEHIEDYWDQYQYCLNISYNQAGEPGKGSAIFLHCQGENDYTLGCVAIPRPKMEKMLRLVRPDCVVVIDSAENLGAD
jgi:L,D-peptidoglycan transpeptidase YkuD (ErfK/YbiS/YcfS/YnhG family)